MEWYYQPFFFLGIWKEAIATFYWRINSFDFCQNVCYHIYIIYDKMGGIGDGGKQEKGF